MSGTGLDHLATNAPLPGLLAGIDGNDRRRGVSFDYEPLASTLPVEGRRLMLHDELIDMQRQPTREASPDMTNYNDSMALEVRSLRGIYVEKTLNLAPAGQAPIDTGRLSSSIHVKDSIPTPSAGEVDVQEVVRTMRELMDETIEFEVMLYFAGKYEHHAVETRRPGTDVQRFDRKVVLENRLGTKSSDRDVTSVHNIGMSRLGPEPIGVVTEAVARARYGSRWAAAADRETARRVWFSLLEMDYTYAPEHNFTYIVQWDRQRSIEPANVNDEELVGFGPVSSHPLSRHTDMTFFLNRLHFIYPVRDFVDLVTGNDGVRYDFIEETHKSLIAVTGRLSPFYRVSADPEAFARNTRHATRLIAEQRAINCHGHLRILRLHRIYLGQSYKSAKFALSRDSVTQSVRFITEKHLNKRDRANIPLRYWAMNYALLTATIALFIGFCHSGMEENLTELRHCLAALKLQSGCSSLIASASTLQTLLGKSDSVYWGVDASRKRKEPLESHQGDLHNANRPFRSNEIACVPHKAQGRDNVAQPAVYTAQAQPSSHAWQNNQRAAHLPEGTADMAIHADPSHFVGPSQMDIPQGFDPGLLDSSFHTEDANLLEFFRYGLAQWPEDATNIWPPVNDFGGGGV
ncbi:hypothetical protein QFC22_000013 [Naganishia vaughanmartiniae]|uniref:Uncharacterized protein n=1 Tax=Naganishia vaughanmartiniae TaxID=1424756 RepID=A0ACC2XN75_9TREE|nr:hypothetical protein QFC22_000013 [Naganishia vaughanmartiniae]